MTNMRVEHWRNQNDWPADVIGPPAGVYLLRATLRLGQSMHRWKWEGDEPIATAPPNLPLTLSEAGFAEQTSACRILGPERQRSPGWLDEHGNRRAWVAPPSLAGIDNFTVPIKPYPRSFQPLDDEDWARARELQQTAVAEELPKWRRWQEVLQVFLDGLRSGAVRTLVQPSRGGSLSPAPPGLWDTTLWSRRFDFGQIDVVDPFSIASAGTRWSHIFVHTDDFAKFESSRRGANMGGEGQFESFVTYMADIMRNAPGGKTRPQKAFLVIANRDFSLPRDKALRAFKEAQQAAGVIKWFGSGRPPK